MDQTLRRVAVIRRKEAEKGVDSLDERFSLLVSVHDEEQGTAGVLPQQKGVERFGGGGEAGERGIAAA